MIREIYGNEPSGADVKPSVAEIIEKIETQLVAGKFHTNERTDLEKARGLWTSRYHEQFEAAIRDNPQFLTEYALGGTHADEVVNKVEKLIDDYDYSQSKDSEHISMVRD